MRRVFCFLFLSQIILLTGCKPKELTPAQRMKAAQEAQENKKKIELPDFVFRPNNVQPEFGISNSVLCTSCSIKVTKKRIDANMPYLGHFYIRPMSRFDVPINFTSTKFLYIVAYDQEDGVFHATLSPEDAGSVMNSNMVFHMWLRPDGTGTVKVKSDNRDEITYDGNFY